MRRYVGGQRIYFAMARLWERADLVLDNSASEPRAIKAMESSPVR